MKRTILHIGVALLTFLIGISADIAINFDYYESTYLEYPAARPNIPLEECNCQESWSVPMPDPTDNGKGLGARGKRKSLGSRIKQPSLK